MERVRFWRAAALVIAGASLLCAQGLTTTATKDDWEEINFEFGSSVLSDGYPSLLRLAELLHQNPDYRVTADGNADSIGSDRVNDKLAAARAGMVMQFLVKYGANPNQISIVAHGKKQPKVSNHTKEGRLMNRRVVLTVADAQGKTVSAGGIGDAIKAMQAAAEPKKKCCDEVLKRLDKLDEILAAIKDLKTENDKLKQDMAALKQAQTGVEKQVAEMPHPPERAELQKMMDTTANNAIDKAKPSRFSLLGINVGPSVTDVYRPGQVLGPDGFSIQDDKYRGRGITLTGKGQYFAPFGRDETAAVQAGAEYMYYRDRQEGQFDIGLVNRWTRVQAGLFSSIKHVELTGLGGGTLGQASLTADVLFSRGKIGVFGTKGYLTDTTIARMPTQMVLSSDKIGTLSGPNYNLLTEYYLRVVDQFGLSTQVGLWNNAYVEGNFGALFRSGGDNRPGGTVRLVQPFSTRFAATMEASLNETMIGSKNNGRVAFGVQFGNWVKPKDFMTVKHPVPVDVPRLRYEVLTRQVRVAQPPPVADAGPNQIGVAAGTITLDASASRSPEALALTYKWTQIAGPTVALASDTSARTTFTAADGQTYQFRVKVTDSLGGEATATTTVSVKAAKAVQIVFFGANPSAIKPGASSVLQWQVEGADTVTISGVGTVNSKAGTVTVTPAQTTAYTLTATSPKGQATQVVTVTVTPGAVQILNFQAAPLNINAGQTSTLQWQTQNADTVTISGIGTVAQSGSSSVSPTQTTTYTLTAANSSGQATATVTVTIAQNPSIASFTANPASISAGQSSTLTWTTQGAAVVSISGVGAVQPNGSVQVSPTQTTAYTLTATSASGASVVKQVTVTVSTAPTPGTVVIVGGPHIYSHDPVTALTATVPSNPGGGAIAYHWSAPSGAMLSSPDSATTYVNPLAYGDYTITVTATDSKGQSTTASVVLTYLPAGEPFNP